MAAQLSPIEFLDIHIKKNMTDTQKIRCMAVDDEPLALQQLAYYIGKVPFFELAACCQSAMDAMRQLDVASVDVLFVDINMPDLNGLDFVRSLDNAPMVVFTTAYQEYAVEGYRVNAIDYLLKPFGMADILRVAEKVKRQYTLEHSVCLSPIDEYDAMFLRAEYKVVRILVQDIVCVEGYGEYLRITLNGRDKPLVVYLSMKKMEERLAGRNFMRIHKSYIINLRHIAEINKNRVVLDTDADIPIGDSYRDKLQNYVSMKFLGK